MPGMPAVDDDDEGNTMIVQPGGVGWKWATFSFRWLVGEALWERALLLPLCTALEASRAGCLLSNFLILINLTP